MRKSMQIPPSVQGEEILNTVPTKRSLLRPRKEDLKTLESSGTDGEIVENLMQDMQQGSALDSIEVVDTLIKDGMTQAYKKLMHVKEQFKRDPRSFDPSETNIKILFKEQVERDERQREEEEAEKLELLSMKEYIRAFCKKFNVNMRIENFPISLFMD